MLSLIVLGSVGIATALVYRQELKRQRQRYGGLTEREYARANDALNRAVQDRAAS